MRYENEKDRRRDKWFKKTNYKNKNKLKNFSKLPRPDLNEFPEDEQYSFDDEEELDTGLDESIEKIYPDEDQTMKKFFAVWCIIVLANFAVLGVCCWAVYKFVTHCAN